jgi:hypothetical protein
MVRSGAVPGWPGIARPSEVDDWRETTATAGRSICRSAAIRRLADQLAIGEHHIYDF